MINNFISYKSDVKFFFKNRLLTIILKTLSKMTRIKFLSIFKIWRNNIYLSHIHGKFYYEFNK